MTIWFSLCILVGLVIASGPTADYCFFRCANNKKELHVISKRLPSCPKPTKCKEYEANKKWRQLMLNMVYDARNGLANGSEKFNFGNTGAKNMHALSYDMELEYLITCFLNQFNKPRVGRCLESVRFPAHHGGVETTEVTQFGDNLWKRLIPSVDNCIISHRTDEVVWYHKSYHGWCSLYFWEATLMGCAIVIQDGWSTILCTYGLVHISLPGDLPGVYKIAKHPGEIASECEEGRNRKYPAVCGNINEAPAEKMWSRQMITTSSSKSKFCSNICNIVMIFMTVRSLFKFLYTYCE